MTDTTHFKEVLTNALTEVTAELETIARHEPETGDWIAVPDEEDPADADPNVEADNVEEWNTRRATVASLETRFRNLTRALAKIDSGTYGICEISGEPIEPERLAANPAARTCQAHMDEEASLPL